MKRVWTIALSAVLAGAMACTAWAADVPSHVGIVTGELPEAFQGKEALLEQNCKKAYEWALQLHAKEAEDGGFQFGQSTDQLLHYTERLQYETSKDVLLQDFDGGNSVSRGAFLFDNWAALICTDPETCQVIVLRDAVAEYMALGGGVGNLPFGAPTTNQYWRMEEEIPVLYQQTEDGYFRSEYGESWFTEFHNKKAEGEFYTEPPQPPKAYGPVDEPSPDGCIWENPLYIGWNAPEEPSSTDTSTGVTSESQPESVDSESDAPVDESIPAGGTITTTSAADSISSSAPSENTSAPVEETSDVSSHPESRTSSGLGANADTSDTGGWNAGLTAGIAAAVVVIAGGGFCLYWFVLRGKRAALPAEGQLSEEPDKEDKTE